MPKKTTAIPSIQFYRTNTRGAAPAAADLKEGELALNLADGQLFAKGTSSIASIGLPSAADATTNYRITAKEFVSTGASTINGTLTVGNSGAGNSNLNFGSPVGTGQIYFNTAGQFVINAVGTANNTTATIYIRPVSTPNASTYQTTFRPDGLVDMPKLNVQGISAFRADMNLQGSLFTNKAATFGSDTAQNKIILDPTGSNGVIRFTGTNSTDIKAEIFGMTDNTGLKIRPKSGSVNDWNFTNDGVLSSQGLVARTRLDIHATNDNEWSAVNFKGGVGSSQKRGLVYAGRDGEIGLSNAAGKQVTWQNDHNLVINSGGFTVGSWVANGELQEPGAKAYFRNKDWMFLEGTNTWTDASLGWVRQVNGIRMDMKRPGATWYAEDCTIQTDGWGEVRRRFVVHADGVQGVFEMTHSGDMFVQRNVVANNVRITSDIRHKDKLVSISSALDKLDKISGYTYEMKTTGLKSAGIIAQELKDVLPEAVDNTDPEHLKVEYSAVVGLLVNAIKELRSEVKQLRGE
ncbi:hypothetical protein MYO4S_00104 [Serratia phage 4S]|nr:hypothetical protein MYO4S_00104 [Serratia phage 4S]